VASIVNAVQIILTQQGKYPLTGHVSLKIKEKHMPQLYMKQPSGRYTIAEADCVLDAASQFIDKIFATGECLTSNTIAGDLLKVRLAHKAHEVFYVLFLDNRHRIIAEEEMFRGTIDSASVYPREVVKRALQHNAGSVILAHNHPSGVVEPSQSDIAITNRLLEILKLVDITVLDHFVVGKDVYSFAEHGRL